MNSSQPPATETWQSELRRGLEHLRRGQIDHAEACFLRAHGLAPDRPEVCYALGRARLQEGAVAEAEALLRTAWQGDHSLVSAAGALARCLGLHAQRFDEAHAVLDEAAAEHGSLALLYVVRSELFLAQDRLDEARAAAEMALQCPDRETEREAACAALARALNREGIVHGERGEHDRAVFLFKRAAQLDPHWSSPYVNLGAAFARMGMHDRALAAYEQAVAIEPGNPVAHENRGLLMRHQGDLVGARHALMRALELEPRARSAAVTLAAISRELGHFADAVTVLSDAIEQVPDDPDLWFELGAAFVAAGERESAEASWRRALQLAPEHRAACAGLAELLAREGRLSESAALAQRAQRTARASSKDGVPLDEQS